MPTKAPVVFASKNLLDRITGTIEGGRKKAVMSAVSWEIRRQLVEFEQKGKEKAEYGERVVESLAQDLEARFGRGFRKSNLYQFRRFYLTYSDIFQTPSGKLKTGRASTKGRPLSKKTGRSRACFEILRTRSAYVFSIRAKIRGAHACSVLVFAFCEDELLASHGDPRWDPLKGSLFRQNASTTTPGGVRSPEQLRLEARNRKRHP